MTNYQNILIKYLKHKVATYNYEPITAILSLGDGLPPYEYKAYQSLTSGQEFEVIRQFAEWGLSVTGSETVKEHNLIATYN